MTAREIVHSLEGIGYTLTVVDGKVCGDRQDILLPPPEALALLDQLREHKGAVLDLLLCRGFVAVPPGDGGLHAVTVDATDEREMLRWAVAVDTGLITRAGKILYRTGPNTATIRYRCAFPPEWLPDAITKAAKEKYKHTAERIRKGEEWLQTHGKDCLEYQKAYDGYLALYENLRKLYVAIDEPLEDPMTGYEGVAAQ